MSDQATLAPALFAPLPIQKLAGLAASTGTMATAAVMPLAAHASATGAEAAALASRRGTAWLNHTRTLAACREPNTWMAASQAFWQQAASDYAESSQRVLASWMKAAQSATQGLQPLAMAAVSAATPPVAARDFITFKEPGKDLGNKELGSKDLGKEPAPQADIPVRKPDSRRSAA